MNIILSKNKAKIFDASPQLKNYQLDGSLLNPFPHIREFGQLKINKVMPGTLELHQNLGMEICHIKQGIYKWNVEEQEYMLYPGNSSFTCPWQKHGSADGFLDLGYLNWMIITPEEFSKTQTLKLGQWSSLSIEEQADIHEIFVNSKNKQIFTDQSIDTIFQDIIKEIIGKQIGYKTRVNGLIDELLITTARALCSNKARQSIASGQNDTILEKIKSILQNQLHHNWTVKELATHVNMKLTKFNDYIKAETGCSPHQFIINYRIKVAKSLLSKTNKSITEIALECGFYSSQHFAYVFKSRTGLKPKDFRNK